MCQAGVPKPVAVDDLKQAIAEGEINSDWFTDMFAALDELSELGFDVSTLYAELIETHKAVCG